MLTNPPRCPSIRRQSGVSNAAGDTGSFIGDAMVADGDFIYLLPGACFSAGIHFQLCESCKLRSCLSFFLSPLAGVAGHAVALLLSCQLVQDIRRVDGLLGLEGFKP